MQFSNIAFKQSELEVRRISYKKDLIGIIFLFVISFYVVYFTSRLPTQLFFLILLPFFWQSKKDYFWFAFVFVLINEPGGFFSGGSAGLINRIPFYRIGPGLAFSFYDLFILLALIKSIVKGEKPKLLFKKPLKLLLAYAIFLFGFSIIAGMSINNLISLSRIAISFTLIYSISSLIMSQGDIYKLIHLILPFSFLVVFAQFYEVINQKALITLIDPSREIIISSWEGNVRAEVEGVMIIFSSYVFSLFYLSKKDYQGSKAYRYTIIIVCLISVIISATRSWIGMFISILVLYYLFVEKLNRKVIFSSFFVLIFILIAYKVLPIFQNAINAGFSRFETVKYLAEGDITAGGTLSRFDVRLPIILEGFYQNPIIGWGFSDTYFKYADGHVGNFNLLLQVGIVGFIFWIYFWFFFFKTTNNFIKHSSFENKAALKVLNLGVIGMLILHFTTYQFFAYTEPIWGIFFISMYFSLANNILVYSKYH